MLPDEIGKYIKALDEWLEQIGRISRPPAALSAEERKQLQAVNKAVEQLQRTGVPVPADLRGLKLKLTARDVSVSQDSETASHLKSIENVIHALEKTIKTARTIRDRLKSTGQAVVTKRYYGITLLNLIQDGMLTIDDRLELQWLNDGPVLKGKVKSDGTVSVKTPEGWRSYPSLSTAASRVAGQSLNGWKHWRRVNSDGSTTALAAIRARYIKEEAGG